MDPLSAGSLAALIGLATGALLGLSARLGRFCTLGAIETALYGADQLRLRVWGIVLGVAIAATYLGAALGWVNLQGTLYHQIAFDPAAAIVGGLLFGYGMALAGNCGFGALIRLGGGDLRSLMIVVVMGVFAFVALSGPLAPLRVMLFPQEPATAPQGIAQTFNALAGIPDLLTALVIAAGLIMLALAHAPLRESPRDIAWAVVSGLAIALAFFGTSHLDNETLGQVQPEGLSFSAPIGRTLLYLMTSTAGGLGFSVGAVAGVLAGALAGTLWRGRFQWEAFDDPRELGRHIGGAALMGVGGVIALGCSVGQGVSGFATLAWSAPVTLLAIVAGAMLGLRQLIASSA